MLLRWRSQHVREEDKEGVSPTSRRRLASYSPMARNGPSKRQPDTMERVYSGRWRNTRARTCAMSQKQTP